MIMVEKKEKAPKTKIEIQTRKPEKRGIFDNLGSDRPKNEHPLREILNFPSDLDIQTDSEKLAYQKSFGYPNTKASDSQNNDLGNPKRFTTDSPNLIASHPNNQKLDSQAKLSGYPAVENLDSQLIKTGEPEDLVMDIQTKNLGDPSINILDSQSEKFGYPKGKTTDSLIAEPEKGLSKSAADLDSKISKDPRLDSPPIEKKTDWTKYEKKRKSKGVFLRTSDEITKRFKQFCIAQDWDFSQGTELAWNKLMNDLDSQAPGTLDSLIALDDRRLKMMFKTKPFIINLYLRYNSVFNELAAADGKKWSARWSPRDDEAALRYNEMPAEIVELGILQTQIQKGFRTSRIQTFKYYTDEIEKVLSSGVSDEMLETILKYHRQIWKNQTGREIDPASLDSDK